jgi:hypothetical protein
MISETSNQKFRSVLSLSVFGLFFNLDYQPPKRKWHSSWSCHATFERLSEGFAFLLPHLHNWNGRGDPPPIQLWQRLYDDVRSAGCSKLTRLGKFTKRLPCCTLGAYYWHRWCNGDISTTEQCGPSLREEGGFFNSGVRLLARSSQTVCVSLEHCVFACLLIFWRSLS